MIASEEKSKRIGEVTHAPFNAIAVEKLTENVLIGWDHHSEEHPEKGVEYTIEVKDVEWSLHIHPEKGIVRLEKPPDAEALLHLDGVTSIEFNRSTGILTFTNPDKESYEISEGGQKHEVKNKGAIRGRQTLKNF